MQNTRTLTGRTWERIIATLQTELETQADDIANAHKFKHEVDTEDYVVYSETYYALLEVEPTDPMLAQYPEDPKEL